MHFLSQGTLTPLQGWPIFCEYPERCSRPFPFSPTSTFSGLPISTTSTSPKTLAPVRLAGLSPFAPLALPGEPDAEVHDRLYAAASAAAGGQVRMMAVPEPYLLWAATLPPCDCTMCLTMERPRPVPPRSRERALSAR